MNPSRIEKAIDKIYDYIESCKPTKLYPNKVVVEKGELFDLIDELRICAPEEIKRYQKIISNRDAILNEAQKRADSMVSQAEEKTSQILDESEIVQAAYQRAEQIMKQAEEEAISRVNQAQEESDQMRKAALMYTNDLLVEASKHIEETLNEAENKHRMYASALKNGIQTIKANREELLSQLEPEKYAAQEEVQEQPVNEAESTKEDDFEVPEDAFLKDVE